MKKIFKTFIILGLVASSTSCKKFLDVNTNPNDVTAATPDLIMPQALTATASISNTFNGSTYGMDLGGYIANAGGVGGFGNFWTFVFNSGDANALWNNTFDNLQDYQYIINNTTATGDYKNFNAVARLMKSFDYLRLVDAYGDVPYSEALKGAGQLLPKYDKGSDVYKACITEIDAVIAQMKVAATASTVSLATNAAGRVDVTVYSGNTTSNVLSTNPGNADKLLVGKDMTYWIKFANTIKLRALIRIQKSADLSAFYATEKATMTSLTSADFIAADVLVNPGYVQQAGKMNPLWTSLGFTATGGNATASFLPSTFAVAFYDGTKLKDDGRGKLIYRQPTTGATANTYVYKNQLGFQSTSLISNPSPGGAWYVGTAGGGSPSAIAATGYGIMKGFDMGQPLMLAAESYFLQAEAALIGLVPGNVSTLFDAGITASFTYNDKDHLDVLGPFSPSAQVATYKTDNASSYLVNSALWATPVAADYNQDVTQRTLEAIITQKYIAVNTLNSEEGWNDYRRTYNATIKSGYPRSTAANTAADAPYSFAASFQTNTSPRADKLAGRILYPASEFSLNTANVPTVDVNSTLVFWDARPKN